MRLTNRVTAIIGLLFVAPFFTGYGWYLELPAHFTPHIAIAASFIFALAAATKERLAAGVCIVVAVASSYMLFSIPVAPLTAEVGVLFVTQNLESRNRKFDNAILMLREENPDIVALQELTPEWHSELSEVLDSYKYSVVAAAEGGFGIGLYSRLPIIDSSIVLTGGLQTPFVVAEISSDRFAGFVIGVHFQPPTTKSMAEDRDRQLVQLSTYLAALDRPYIVVGDFNNTPVAPSLRRFLQHTSSQLAAPTWLPTWPDVLGPFGIPIDMVVGSPGITFHDRSLTSPIGSDHRGLRFRASIKNARQYTETTRPNRQGKY